MTACVNKKSKRVAAVVTASLVGALSIGAPAVALATTGASIDMLAVNWSVNAKISKATDGKGHSLASLDQVTFTITNGKSGYMVPVEATSDYAPSTDLTADGFTTTYTVPIQSENNFVGLNRTWSYRYKGADGKYVKIDADGTLSADEAAAYFNGDVETYNGSKDLQTAPSNGNIIPAAGIYSVTVAGNDGSVSQTFKLKAADAEDPYEGTYAYEGTDVADKTFVYNGGAQVIKFAKADGTELKVGKDYDSTKSYLLKADGSKVMFSTDTADAAYSVTEAGTYNVVLVNSSNVELVAVTFTVSELDITKAELSLPDFTKTTGVGKDAAAFISKLSVDGTAWTGGTTNLSVTSVTGPDGKLVNINDSFYNKADLKSGEYTATVTAKEVEGSLAKGSATVKFYVLDNELTVDGTTVLYNGTKVGSGIELDLSKGEVFDASKVTVKIDKTVYSGDQLELSFKKGGKTVSAEDIAKAVTSDTFEMDVRVKPFYKWDNETWTGGSTASSLKINVTGTDLIADENVAFYLNGELSGNAGEVDYDGTDALKKLSVAIKANGKTYEQGKDYTLEVKKADKAVTEAVDAGEYKLAVKPVTFKLDKDQTFTLTVKAIDLKLIPAATSYETGYFNDKGQAVAGKKASVAYTGMAIAVPGVKYEVENSDHTFSYVDLDSKLYDVISISDGKKNVKEVVDKGTYTVKVSLSDEAKSNYTLTTATFTFTVAEFGHFSDVESAEWYSVPVEKAYEEGYINGISGTNLFAPKADITRADAVCILFNMAGGVIGNSDFSYNENTGYETGFSDVDGHAYFAKALAWAKASGVANGSNGQFRPYDKITREEFVSLLANFAKSKGDYEAVDADEVLAGATDYTGWAKENVAWAKANGIMGNNGAALDGTGKITRAQVAAMAVNYQPENLTGLVRDDEGNMVKPSKTA